MTGGEVVVLDSGGYDQVVITKGISLIAPPGVYAGVTVNAGNGIDVVAGSNDVVVISGLTIHSDGGTAGISITAQGSFMSITAC